MTSVAQVFQFETGEIRTAIVDGVECLVGKDVCAAIGISKYRDALAQLDEPDERVSAVVDTPGGPQEMAMVNEPGLYALMLISRSPKVKPFRKWVIHEVLPALRKTGRYELAESNPPIVAIAAQSEIDKAAVARAQIEMLGVAVSVGLLDKLWATSKTHVIAARILGEESEQADEEQQLYVPDFIKSKGVKSKKDITSIQSWFGIRAVEIGEANGIEIPKKRPRELPDGTIRPTIAWRNEHLPLFEQVWETYYAAKYDPPMVMLELGAA